MSDALPTLAVEPRWYALRTFTGHEAKVKSSIELEMVRLGMENRVLNIIIPTETVFEVRNGKRRTRVKNFLPGYILIEVSLDNRLRDFIVSLPSIVGFAGTTSGPQPLQKDEVDRILGRVEERKDITTAETSFREGDPVKVIEGPFANFNGTVKEVNVEKQKLKVEVGILGRKTPIELDFNQVEIENH
ncbi:MAG: transcription termination/antitermination protein NusG [Ignavibacteria bacterium]|jgi:transcriptional antiterminator NusG